MKPEFFEDTEVYQRHFTEEEVPYPTVALLETTSLCNLECPMCPLTIGKSPSLGKSANMDMVLLERLRDLFQHLDTVILSWFGEPLIHRQLPEIVEHLKGHGLQVQVTSNAVLLKEALAEKLVRAGLDVFNVSIDGATAETYRRIRVGAELETVKEKVRMLVEARERLGTGNPFLQVAFVAMPENIEELPDMVRLTHELGITQLVIDPVDDFALTEAFKLDEKAVLGPKERARKAYFEANEIARELGVTISINTFRFYREIGEWPEGLYVDEKYFRNDYTPQQTAEMGLRKGCGVPWMHTVIGQNGDVHPCCVSSRVLGNVYKQSFSEVWHGAAYQEFRQRLKSTNPMPECWRCRRAIWNGSYPLDELRSFMEVGVAEVPGLGASSGGVDALGRAFRRVERESTFFLKYQGEDYLVLVLAPAEWERVCGRVVLNDRELGGFRLRPSWHRVYFRVPQLEGEFAKVKVINDSAVGHLLIHRAELRLDSVLWERAKNRVWEGINWARARGSRESRGSSERIVSPYL